LPPVPSRDEITSKGLNFLSETYRTERLNNMSDPESLELAARKAKALGVKKFLASPSQQVLDLLKKNPEFREFEIFALVPDFQQFVRDTSNYGTTGAATRRILKMPIIKKIQLAGVGMRHMGKALKFQFELLMNLFLMAEASRIPKPKAVLLHSQITDLALSMDQPGLFDIFYEIVSRQFGAEPGLCTLNLPRLTQVLKERGLKYPWLMAPFNPKGYQMNPSQSECHNVVKNVESKVIADHWDLYGTIPLKEARVYVESHAFSAATIELNHIPDTPF